MDLQKQQDLLARLYTDNTFRSEFLRKPSRFAESGGVSPDEAAALARVAASEVEWFAESLLSKRLREVRKMLPMTEQEMGSKEFARSFRVFADGFSPTSVKKHLEDSLAFAAWLVTDPSLDDSERGIVRFERSRLCHNALGRKVSVCLLRSDPRRVTGYTNYEKPRGVGVWIAIGAWSRIFFRRNRKSSVN